MYFILCHFNQAVGRELILFGAKFTSIIVPVFCTHLTGLSANIPDKQCFEAKLSKIENIQNKNRSLGHNFTSL